MEAVPGGQTDGKGVVRKPAREPFDRQAPPAVGLHGVGAAGSAGWRFRPFGCDLLGTTGE